MIKVKGVVAEIFNIKSAVHPENAHTKEVDFGNFLNRWNSEDVIEFSVEVGGEGDMVQRIGR